ncbi:hypothetical protein NCCP1664_15090 [Zafaria cholistanensis]|uniref:Uncharacterized protein n=1 Tax=Zafaria cholistanensis TaxID=1682741 RepID=A0A5A7NQ70_9MICC|nr:DUF6098 family protein [Zafaria cholistanensis]GER23013.1 hypothetical protein NCCP1664_15090 [Zafaria cholistanensis]
MALPHLHSIAELEDLVRSEPDLYVRYSAGYESDRDGGSLDTESGIELPGLSVNPLRPESWWTRPLQDWLARQLCQYKHLKDKNPDRYAWVARGHCIARGPDCEPLLTGVTPVARLSDALLDEAQRIYEDRFDAGTGPED